MTFRAAILGLLGAIVLAAATFFNDRVMHGTFLIASYMPISVFGVLVVFLLVLNPLLRGFGKRASLSGREIAVVVSIVLMTCFIPGRGLIHHFTNFLMLPRHHERTSPGWQVRGVVDSVPKQMLASVDTNETLVLDGFVGGLAEGDKAIPFTKVPWSAWSRTFLFWGPLILSMAVAAVGLSLVVHRQWSTHEHLPYPIATFVTSLLPQEGESRGAIFRNRLFLIGTAAVFLFHANNYAYEWFPQYFVRIPRTFNLSSFTKLFPNFAEGGGWQLLGYYILFHFMAVGFAYFLPADVSLSIGIAPFLYAAVIGFLIRNFGIEWETWSLLEPTTDSFLYAGSYFGLFLTLAYTGRHYYLNVFRSGLFLPCSERTETTARWGARLFIAGAFLFGVQLCLAGLDWQLAVLYTAGLFIILTVASRVVAETGTFFIHPWHLPCAVMLGILGYHAVGPVQAIIMGAVSSVILINPREAVMPFVMHAIKIAEDGKARMGRTAAVGIVAIAASLVVAVGMALYLQYWHGAVITSDTWTMWNVPRFLFDTNVKIQETLDAQGALESSRALSGWGHFLHVKPNPTCMTAFGITFTLVLLFSFARLRYPKWPLHPVMFLVLGTWTSHMLAASFLAGFLIKSAVTRYGGASLYQKLKPLMIGLIAGDMLGGLLPMIVGPIYYFATNPHRLPKSFTVFQ